MDCLGGQSVCTDASAEHAGVKQCFCCLLQGADSGFFGCPFRTCCGWGLARADSESKDKDVLDEQKRVAFWEGRRFGARAEQS